MHFSSHEKVVLEPESKSHTVFLETTENINIQDNSVLKPSLKEEKKVSKLKSNPLEDQSQHFTPTKTESKAPLERTNLIAHEPKDPLQTDSNPHKTNTQTKPNPISEKSNIITTDNNLTSNSNNNEEVITN